LQRYGNGLIDNLTYTYNGNQLTKVEDATGNAAGFSNGASAANEYTYDNNGNLTKDSNKNISSIAYNCLNLPNKVTFSDGSTIVYSYAADGTKLRTVHTINGTTTTKDYCSNVVYENGVQKMLLTEEGYVDLSASTPTYYYYLKDHQGNNRVVVNKDGAVKETNHYYPFGGLFDSDYEQPYKYNGKELDTQKGLNWYDYGARHYDATLGRWFAMDPLAEKMGAWSPYAYCYNNPVRFIDPNGTDGWDVVVGYSIGFITNILPNTGFIRDSYTPTDVSDYNNALRGMDNASMALGKAMIVAGSGTMFAGETMTATGVTLTIGSAGAASTASIPTAISGVVVTEAGAITAASGVNMMNNAQQNKEAGYDRGKKSADSSGNKNSSQYSKEPPGELIKLKNGQGWKDPKTGNIWKRDMKHKDHYDVTNPKTGKKVKEVDFEGNQIWPNGPKNKNKR